MTLTEYESILVDLVLRNVITVKQAQNLRQRFIAGLFDEEDLPLPLVQAKEKDEDNIYPFFFTGTRNTLSKREYYRNQIMNRFDTTVQGEPFADMTVKQFHSETMRILSNAMLTSWLAGNGTRGASADIDAQIDEQLMYLYRFAADTHARQAIGEPYSQEYMTNRLSLYGGAVWASWFRGNESIGGDRLAAQYIARDDGRTCSPCRAAEGVYPLNAGPYPGDVCLGGGRCRCERVVIVL